MNLQPNKDEIKRLSIGMIAVAYRVINAEQVREHDKAREVQVIMIRDKWITTRDIISRQKDDRILTEEDGYVRISEIRQGYGNTEGRRREAKREANNKRREKRVSKIESNRRRRRHKKGSCSWTRQIRNELAETERRNKASRALEGRTTVQRRLKNRRGNTTGVKRMATRRWMRSNEEGGNRGRGDQEKKGKGLIEGVTAEEIFMV